MSALVAAALVAVVFVVPASAQLLSDPLARSPRLLGLGRLEVVVDDPHNRLTMWDFAANPTGIYHADSGSTLEVRPNTGSQSSVMDEIHPTPGLIDQTFAARRTGLGFEAWRRASGAIAYGFSGELASQRTDDMLSPFSELRQSFQIPDVQGALSGPMPYLLSQALRYAVRIGYRTETERDQYRETIVDGAGRWIDRKGLLVDPPDPFIPDHTVISRLGGGVAVSYDFGRPLQVAAGVDLSQDKVRSDNTGDRSLSTIREDRPYRRGQLTLLGRLGPHLEYGADAHGWKAASNAKWLFTISGGQGGSSVALSGWGNLYRREEEGRTLRTRAQWTQAPLRLAAGLATGYRQVRLLTPSPGDPTSFNRFRNFLYYRARSESLVLVLPDSVSDLVTEERVWEATGGVSWTRLPRRAQIGVEVHAWQDLTETDVGGLGPKPSGWDVRAGLEVPLSPVLTARGGYIYDRTDQDRFTRSNEFVTHSLTLGLGLKPPGTRWGFDAGYVLGHEQADFGDPGVPRSSLQSLAAQLRWQF